MYVCMTVFLGSKFFLLLAKTSDGLNYFCFIKLLCVLSPFSCVQLFATPWTHQAPLSMGILQARILGVGCHSLFQGIFLAQGSNLGFLHCRQILYHLSHKERV